MFKRQPRSPARTNSAPVATMSVALSLTILSEMSGYLTQNMPPKPQHVSAPGQLFEPEPVDRRQQPARLILRPRARVIPSTRRGRSRGVPSGRSRPASRRCRPRRRRAPSCVRQAAAPVATLPDHLRIAPGNEPVSFQRMSRTAQRRSHSPRRRGVPAARSPLHSHGRPHCRPAGRSKSAPWAPRPCSLPPRAILPPRSRSSAETNRPNTSQTALLASAFGHPRPLQPI